MSNCSKHKKEVAGISDMKELAEMIGDLHYEALADFFYHFIDKLNNDGMKDRSNGRMKLADCLQNSAHYIEMAHAEIKEAWQISKPFMISTPPQEGEPEAKAIAEAAWNAATEYEWNNHFGPVPNPTPNKEQYLQSQYKK